MADIIGGGVIDPIKERARQGPAGLSPQQRLRLARLIRAKALYEQTKGTPSAEEAGLEDPLRRTLSRTPELIRAGQGLEDPFFGALDVQTESGHVGLPAVGPAQRGTDWEAILRVLAQG